MPTPDFLKKLQESLEKGEKTAVSDYLNQIDKLASTLSAEQAAEKLDKRIEDVGKKDVLNEEERKVIDEVLDKLDLEQKENDEKLLLLANIQQMTADICNLKIEYESTKIGYETKINQLNEEKLALIAKFEETYDENINDEILNNL